LEEARESLRVGNKKTDPHLLETNQINGKTFPPIETTVKHEPVPMKEEVNQANEETLSQKPYKLKLCTYLISFSLK
jgi:hypothetical protein